MASIIPWRVREKEGSTVDSMVTIDTRCHSLADNSEWCHNNVHNSFHHSLSLRDNNHCNSQLPVFWGSLVSVVKSVGGGGGVSGWDGDVYLLYINQIWNDNQAEILEITVKSVCINKYL